MTHNQYFFSRRKKSLYFKFDFNYTGVRTFAGNEQMCTIKQMVRNRLRPLLDPPIACTHYTPLINTNLGMFGGSVEFAGDIKVDGNYFYVIQSIEQENRVSDYDYTFCTPQSTGQI